MVRRPASAASMARVRRPDADADVLVLVRHAGVAGNAVGVGGRRVHAADIELAQLVGAAGRQQERADPPQRADGQPHLLLRFAAGRRLRRLAVVAEAGGKLHQHRIEAGGQRGQAELLDQHDGVCAPDHRAAPRRHGHAARPPRSARRTCAPSKRRWRKRTTSSGKRPFQTRCSELTCTSGCTGRHGETARRHVANIETRRCSAHPWCQAGTALPTSCRRRLGAGRPLQRLAPACFRDALMGGDRLIGAGDHRDAGMGGGMRVRAERD